MNRFARDFRHWPIDFRRVKPRRRRLKPKATIAFVQSASNTQITVGSTSMTVTLSAGSGNGNTLALSLTGQPGTGATFGSITDNAGNVYVPRILSPQSNSFSGIYVCVGVKPGATQITIPFNFTLAASQGMAACWMEFSGVVWVGQVNDAFVANTSPATQSINIQAANNWIVASAWVENTGTTWTTTAGTELMNSSLSGSGFPITGVAGYNSGTTVGSSVAFTGTISPAGNNEWGISLLELSTVSTNLVQLAKAGNLSSITTLTATLPHGVVAGDLICAATMFGAAVGSLAIKDGNNNTLTITPKSPALLGTAHTDLAYLLSTPTNATQAWTATWTTATAASLFIAEFTAPNAAVFDNDAAKSNGTASGTTINLPAITPAATAELLYAGVNPAAAITAPVAGATLGGWTGAGIDSNLSTATEYILSAGTSSQPVDFTDSTTSDSYGAMVMAFAFPGPPSSQPIPEGAQGNTFLGKTAGRFAGLGE